MSTRKSIAASFICLLVASSLCGAGRRPNFVIFFTDDQGYNDVGCFGSELIRTPNLDRMAAEGMRFTNFYVQPVCGVSRAAMMTGCYPIRVAEPGNTKSGHPVLHPREITMAEVLKTVGYRTGLIGKWHLAGGRRDEYPPELMPNQQGFDYFFGTPLHNGFTRTVEANSFRTQLMRNSRMLDDCVDQEEMNLLVSSYTEEAVQLIRENKDGPFFLYLAHNMPHVPLGVADRFRGKSKRGRYGDVIQELDWSVGEVLKTLEEVDIDEQTLVVFTSDNGPWIEEHLAGEGGIDAYYGSADPLRGAKMMTWEGGLRVPCIVRWPGKVPAGTVCDEIATSMDLLPTFARLAGAELPDDRVIDGKDIWSLMSGQPGAKTPHEAFFYYAFVHLEAVRSGKWKLVLPRPARPRWTSWSARMIDAVPEVQLYDLQNDIGEEHNVAANNPEVVSRLTELVRRAREDLGDYDRIGNAARFFDDGPRRRESARWIASGKPIPAPRGGPYPHRFTYSDAIGHEPGVTRRDPSDVVRVQRTYYLWYTKVLKSQRGYPSGYPGSVWYATSPDGKTWTEQGPAVEPGPDDAWDGHGVFTPNILVADGKYYLYYTAVPEPFDVPWTAGKTPTAIGVAVAASPDGPWKKFDGNPILEPSNKAEDFDSFRVDDAALVVRDHRIWLYYKGRSLVHGQAGPGKTRMGVAISALPVGPFAKQDANPLHAGHEVMVWPHGKGVASMATAAGPRMIYFAEDGLHFQPRNALAAAPGAPGAFRNDHFANACIGQGIQWGICHGQKDGDIYLRRFDCDFTPGERAGRSPRPAASALRQGQAGWESPIRLRDGHSRRMGGCGGQVRSGSLRQAFAAPVAARAV